MRLKTRRTMNNRHTSHCQHGSVGDHLFPSDWADDTKIFWPVYFAFSLQQTSRKTRYEDGFASQHNISYLGGGQSHANLLHRRHASRALTAGSTHDLLPLRSAAQRMRARKRVHLCIPAIAKSSTKRSRRSLTAAVCFQPKTPPLSPFACRASFLRAG